MKSLPQWLQQTNRNLNGLLLFPIDDACITGQWVLIVIDMDSLKGYCYNPYERNVGSVRQPTDQQLQKQKQNLKQK